MRLGSQVVDLLFMPEVPHVVDAAGALSIEIGADVVDIGKTIDPHPTLGESIDMAAVMVHSRYGGVPQIRKQGGDAGPKHCATGAKVHVEKNVPTAPSHPSEFYRGD
jgi:hypothetical protein